MQGFHKFHQRMSLFTERISKFKLKNKLRIKKVQSENKNIIPFFKNINIKNFKWPIDWRFFSNRNELGRRIIVPMMLIIVLVTGSIGLITYNISQKNVRYLIEERLKSEADKMTEKVAILTLVVQDEKEFDRALRKELQRQEADLAQDGLTVTRMFINVDGQIDSLEGINKENIHLTQDNLKNIVEREKGIAQLTIDGIPYTVVYAKAAEIQLEYVLFVQDDEFLAPIYELRNYIFAAMIGGVLLAGLISSLFVRGITRPLEQIVAAIKNVSTGDYTQKISLKSLPKNEIGQLMNNFNTMVEDVSEVIAKIKHSIVVLGQLGNELKVKAEHTEASAHNVSARVGIVSEGANKTVETVVDSKQDFNSILTIINQMTEQFSVVNNISGQLAQAAIVGKGAIGEVIENTKVHAEEARALENTITELRDYSGMVEKILVMIRGIAAQTKLLSLNASIEAARAGEAGRGFAVVAKEVQKLAERTSSAASEIGQIISNIQQKTVIAATNTSKMVSIMDDGYKITLNTEKSFLDLLSGVEKVSSELTLMADKIEEIYQEISDFEQSVSLISGISEQTLTNARDMDESAKQQIVIAQETNSLATNLHAIADQLKISTTHLKVNENQEVSENQDAYKDFKGA